MIEHHIDVPTPDGAMNTFIAHPDEGGPFPVVMFYMDAPGKREELHDMARRIASVGYYVILPNLYYRETREFKFDGSEAATKHMMATARHLSIKLIMQDTQAMLDHIARDGTADAGRIGAVGYCMSGPFVFAAAAHFPDRIACAASIYGANLMTKREDSPHLMADKITAELYFACAEIDHYAPKDVVDALQAYLNTTPLNYRLEWYPGAQHGFAFPSRGTIYDKPSAERHWVRLFDLLRRNLGPT
ncbi:MAG: carboxymethylenebutenolidase [Candidatus Azotimanducaceae bacterium]|jgi:carboxymethylenebutenolidase